MKKDADRAHPIGVRSIIVFKTIKGWAGLALGGCLLVLLPIGLSGWLAAGAAALRHDFVHAWSIRIADAIVLNTSPHRIHLTIGALLLDAAVTVVEAHALKRHLWWGPWLVVATVSALLPFEIVGWLPRPHPLQILLFAANLTVVAYLARYAWRERGASVRRPYPLWVVVGPPPAAAPV